ncbi:hypothetical protein [Nonomuraea dietziae]|uniref:hypothetical protein n=1 Tax=Nonomuraea dietziae TaxID=65515 RepID=UPI00342D5FAC
MASATPLPRTTLSATPAIPLRLTTSFTASVDALPPARSCVTAAIPYRRPPSCTIFVIALAPAYTTSINTLRPAPSCTASVNALPLAPSCTTPAVIPYRRAPRPATFAIPLRPTPPCTASVNALAPAPSCTTPAVTHPRVPRPATPVNTLLRGTLSAAFTVRVGLLPCPAGFPVRPGFAPHPVAAPLRRRALPRPGAFAVPFCRFCAPSPIRLRTHATRRTRCLSGSGGRVGAISASGNRLTVVPQGRVARRTGE